MLGAGAFVRAAKGHEALGIACQDSALALTGQGKALALVCDGCSSGKDSGACSALLASAARQAWLGGAYLDEAWGREAWLRASLAMEMVGLESKKSPSTLLAAQVDGSTGMAEAIMWGDGVLALVNSCGDIIEVWRGQSALNMPAYPAYAFDDALWREFCLAGGKALWALEHGGLGRFEFKQSEGGKYWTACGALEQGEMLLLLSDGVDAVEGRSLLACLSDLASAKGPGGFMERRARKALEAWRAEGCVLGDDFSVAALRFLIGQEGAP
jgi:hypothetical protein